MLLRSSAAPTPRSWQLHYSKGYSFTESEPILHHPRTRSLSLSISKNASQPFTSDTDFLNPSKLNRKNRLQHSFVTSHKTQQGLEVKESDEVEKPLQKTCFELIPSPGFGKRLVNREEEVEVMGNGIGSNGCGGHGSGWDSSDDDWEDNTNSYYQKMITTYPNNALLLGNYAKFLKEVVGDYGKAKEYVERAMLESPGDGNLVSFYAELIWQTEKNADRAEGYYGQAVQIAPHDCYVAASYAKFLWDTEEDEEWDHKYDQNQTLKAASDLNPK